MRRLGTDYIDLYQIHRFDPETPLDETLRALDDVVRAGKVRYLGASSMYAWQFAKALYGADLGGWTRFVSMQNHYNLVHRDEEREMIPLCRAEGVGLIPYSPFARGFLAGNRSRESWQATVRARTDVYGSRDAFRDGDFDVLDRLLALSQKRGESPACLALGWVLHQPGVTAPIIGASRLEQLDDALAALDIELDPAEAASLEEPYQPRMGPGFL